MLLWTTVLRRVLVTRVIADILTVLRQAAIRASGGSTVDDGAVTVALIRSSIFLLCTVTSAATASATVSDVVDSLKGDPPSGLGFTDSLIETITAHGTYNANKTQQTYYRRNLSSLALLCILVDAGL
ncbi:hypothetical protein V491_05171 [Pseudogymnoascus sp. VKM F-3775]|nr:hypothetical protein V491_05171 [Pseudogymnoascus sp. VKM F-3775]